MLVSSAAAANAQPVAEYTVAALVFGLKQVMHHANRYARGQSVISHIPGARTGLTGTTIGLVGASRIGRMVAQRLRSYDVRVLIHDPVGDPAEIRALGAEPCDLETLCATSDAVSLHAPELPETRHLIDEDRLRLMRHGTLLVNTARGALVDTDALTRHCASGRIDAPTVSGPTWATVATGQWPNRHGVFNNNFPNNRLASFPDFLSRVRSQKLHTYLATSWSPLATNRWGGPIFGCPTWSTFINGSDLDYGSVDEMLADDAARVLSTHDMAASFVYLGNPSPTTWTRPPAMWPLSKRPIARSAA